MSVSPLKNLKQQFGVVLACSFAVSILTTGLVLAQVGPQPPQPKPMPENKIIKALEKMKAKKTAAKNGGVTSKPAKLEKDPAEEAALRKQREEAMKRPPMLTQPPLTNAKIEEPQVDPENPPNLSHPKLDDPNNPLGFTDAQNRLKKYTAMVEANRFAEVKGGLIQLRQWLVDMTEAHIGLYKTLNQIPSARAQAELEKELALQFAQLRDRSMVEMAKVYISDKDYSRAVKELTEVVKSQPKSRMGLRSYEMLQEIGFTEKLQLTQ